MTRLNVVVAKRVISKLAVVYAFTWGILYIRTGVQHDEQNQHIPCLAHVINLIVGAFLKNLRVLADGEEEGDDETMHHRIHDGREKDFALTMLKIREISKVQCPVTYKSTFLDLRNRFVRDVFPQG